MLPYTSLVERVREYARAVEAGWDGFYDSYARLNLPFEEAIGHGIDSFRIVRARDSCSRVFARPEYKRSREE